MPVSLAEFNAECTAQGVYFLGLEARLAGGPPDPMVDATKLIGNKLRCSPGVPLTNMLIAGDMWCDDTAALALQGIINASVEPVKPAPGEATFNCMNGRNIGVCSYAEFGFTNTITRLRDENNRWRFLRSYKKLGCNIFMHEGTPLFVQKSDGDPCAVSLDSAVINGIRYPAGSIMCLDTQGDPKRDIAKPPRNEVCRKEAEAIASIAFRRLSIFAYRPDERPGLDGRMVLRSDYDKPAWEWLNSVKIEEVRGITARAVK
jgi:hypothetical protein